MRRIAIILMFWALFWLLELGLYAALFAATFKRLILQFFVTFGSPIPAETYEAPARAVLVVLLSPARLFVPAGLPEAGSWAFFVALGTSGIVWGTVFGLGAHALIMLLRRRRRGLS